MSHFEPSSNDKVSHLADFRVFSLPPGYSAGALTLCEQALRKQRPPKNLCGIDQRSCRRRSLRSGHSDFRDRRSRSHPKVSRNPGCQTPCSGPQLAPHTSRKQACRGGDSQHSFLPHVGAWRGQFVIKRVGFESTAWLPENFTE
jgi:hypothetical protein